MLILYTIGESKFVFPWIFFALAVFEMLALILLIEEKVTFLEWKAVLFSRLLLATKKSARNQKYNKFLFKKFLVKSPYKRKEYAFIVGQS